MEENGMYSDSFRLFYQDAAGQFRVKKLCRRQAIMKAALLLRWECCQDQMDLWLELCQISSL